MQTGESTPFVLLFLTDMHKGRTERRRQNDRQVVLAVGQRQEDHKYSDKIHRLVGLQGSRWGVRQVNNEPSRQAADEHAGREAQRQDGSCTEKEHDTSKDKEEDVWWYRRTYREISRQAGCGGLGSRPGCGVVWWPVVAGERVVWSGALDVGEWVIRGRLVCWVPLWDGHCWRKEDSASQGGKETARQERKWGKVWTMTQGHRPHGDGEGREELLIRACGLSYGYHRTGSVFSPWLLLTRHPAAVTPSGWTPISFFLINQELSKGHIHTGWLLDYLSVWALWDMSGISDQSSFYTRKSHDVSTHRHLALCFESPCWKYCTRKAFWISAEVINALLFGTNRALSLALPSGGAVIVSTNTLAPGFNWVGTLWCFETFSLVLNHSKSVQVALLLLWIRQYCQNI